MMIIDPNPDPTPNQVMMIIDPPDKSSALTLFEEGQLETCA